MLWLTFFFVLLVAVMFLVSGLLGCMIAWVSLFVLIQGNLAHRFLVPFLPAEAFQEKRGWLVRARNRCYGTVIVSGGVFLIATIISVKLGLTFGPH